MRTCPSASTHAAQKERQHQQVLKAVAPKLAKPDQWHPGDAPEQALEWAIDAVDKAGTVSIIGVYPETMTAGSLGNKHAVVCSDAGGSSLPRGGCRL